MTKTLLTLSLTIALSLTLTVIGTVQAKGPSNIRNTVHNLSSIHPKKGTNEINEAYLSSNEDEVCIFCHTPHGGSLTGPLWNRPDTNNLEAYYHYKSDTSSEHLKALSFRREVNDESKLCLSCHDGSVSVHSILNTSNRTPGGVPLSQSGADNTVTINTLFNYVSSRIGDSFDTDGASKDRTVDLMDDHPISLSYRDVLLTKSAEFVADPAKVRFFGGEEKRVECSSCHDPHVDYMDPLYVEYTPFLITSNKGSALCLACHIK